MNYRKIIGFVSLLALAVGAAWLGQRQLQAGEDERGAARPEPPLEVAERDSSTWIAAPESETATREELSESAPVESSAVPSSRYLIHGRLVDARRMAVSGGEIELGGKDRTESLTDGSFELTVERENRDLDWTEGLIAKTRDGAARRVPVAFEASMLSREIDVGTLVLVQGYALQIQVTKSGQPAPRTSLRIEIGHGRVFVLETETDEGGGARIDGLPKGPVHVKASATGHLAYTTVFVPDEQELLLQLEPAGLGDITVVDAQTGEGIAGAQLKVRGQHMVPSALPGEAMRDMRREFLQTFAGPGNGASTDAEGRVAITELLPGTTYKVSVTAGGYVPFPLKRGEEALLQSTTEPIVIELEPLSYRAVRWPIVAGEAPVPPDGSIVTLQHAPGSTRWGEDASSLPQGRMEGTDLSVQNHYANGALLAKAEDGSLAILRCKKGAEVGRETSFRPARRVEVRVRDSEGNPVVGAQAMARNQGNNPLCAWAVADSKGHAVLEGLYGELAEVYLRRPGQRGWGEGVGSVDLAAGDSVLEATLPPEKSPSLLRLTLLENGTPRLPGQFEFNGMIQAQVAEEDPHRGELLVELSPVSPGEEVRLYFSAVGYSQEVLEVEIPPDGSEARQSIDLKRTAVLIADVTLPEEGTVSIFPQKLESGQFATPSSLRLRRGFNVPNGPGGSFVFDGITPGTWRFFEKRSGATSQSYEVTANDREVTIPFRLSSLAWVSGRVEAPSDGDLKFAKVLLAGDSPEAGERSLPAEFSPKGAWLEEGAFRIQIPGDRDVRLTAWHPWLRPDPDTGTLDTRGGQEGVLLKLVPGDELRLPVPELDQSTSSVRIARFSGGRAEGDPLEWHYAPVAEGIARCGLPKGTWTLWVDPGEGFAPLLLPEVEISGVTTLPAATFGTGSTLSVRIEVEEGEAHPRLYLFARRLEEPVIQRGMNSEGEAVPRLSGLSAGRYLVSYGQVMNLAEGVETEIVLDGESETELTFDLR